MSKQGSKRGLSPDSGSTATSGISSAMAGTKSSAAAKTASTKPSRRRLSLSSFSILFLVLIVVAIITVFLQGRAFSPALLPKGESIAHVQAAKLSTVVMAPFNGFKDAVEICIFVLMLGGFLAIVNKTGALESGIQAVIKKLHGHELVIIPIIMTLLSIGGTTFGMSEETLPFYAILTPTLMAAGFDPVVSIGIVLMGSGAGVLGSTVNPFAVGVAVDALSAIHIKADIGIILILGALLWLTTLFISIAAVMLYAARIKRDKGSSILSMQEMKAAEKEFLSKRTGELAYTRQHKIVLSILALILIVMVTSLIPWQKFGIHIFDGWSSFLTGDALGTWYFGDLSMWFLLTGLIIATVFRFGEKETIRVFMAGACDIMPAMLIIVVARGTSVLMSQTHLDLYVLDQASQLLRGFNPLLFVLMGLVIYICLAFLIPSSSGLAYVSMPIMGALSASLGFSPEIMVMIFVAAHGIICLFAPTNGILMAACEMNQMEYSSWFKFVMPPLVLIVLVNLIILGGAILILH